MNGFGFIEYKDAMDARDVVPGMLTHHPAALLDNIRANSFLKRSVR
jgi:hypothetical protein